MASRPVALAGEQLAQRDPAAGLQDGPAVDRDGSRATPAVHATLIAADRANCHQVAAPRLTRTGMANGAVGGR